MVESVASQFPMHPFWPIHISKLVLLAQATATLRYCRIKKVVALNKLVCAHRVLFLESAHMLMKYSSSLWR